MSDDSEQVDADEARDVLHREWDRVLNDNEHNYLDDESLESTIRTVLNAAQLTYKYILVTNVLAKAINPRIHYRAMQANADLPGAYNARSLGHHVLVEWEKDHGERLGGSNEPFLNKPARFPAFAMENAHRSATAHRRLYELLETLEAKTDSNEIEPVSVLRYTLSVVSDLESRTIDFESPSSVPFRELPERVENYLDASGGGERLPAVTAGVMTAYYRPAENQDWAVEAEHANVSDRFSNTAGDVEVFRDGDLVRAIEVKDKPTERSDVQHAIRKARENKLGEYLFVIGDGFRTTAEERASMTESKDASIELVFVFPEDLLAVLKFVADAGRISFVESVGEFLNEMRASEQNKTAWTNLVEDLGNSDESRS